MRWPDEVESPERVSGERRGSGTRNDTEPDRDENGQREAGREAPMGALRSPALGLDAEPRPIDGGFCLAVRMASSGRPGPGGLDEILQSGAPWHARKDMLEHAQSAPRAQRTLHLREASSRVFDAAEHESAQHGVEVLVSERQRFRARGPGGRWAHDDARV